MKKLAYGLAVLSSLVACLDTAPEGPEDPIDATFADGKADTAGVAEGSPQAIGVLRVANERSRMQLVNHGVPSMAATNIEAVRIGDDEAPGTSDDTTFTTLAQLDAVPYVGPIAFARMLAYANALGYVPVTPVPVTTPADLWNVDESCAPMLYAHLLSRFQPGETSYDFPTPFAMAARHRDTCNEATGCTPWHADGVHVVFPYPYVSDRWSVEELPPSGTRRNVRMDLHLPLQRISFSMHGLNGPDLSYECNDIEYGDGIGVSGRPAIRCIAQPSNGRDTASFHEDDSHGDARIYLTGTICADGRFHFRTELGSELGQAVDSTTNRNQIAIYGQL